MNQLGLTYNEIKDYKSAFEMYEKASELGYDIATYNLAGCYYYGKYVSVNKTKAYELYKYVYDKYKDDELMLDDFKTSNWGRRNGELVKVDYGC